MRVRIDNFLLKENLTLQEFLATAKLSKADKKALLEKKSIVSVSALTYLCEYFNCQPADILLSNS